MNAVTGFLLVALVAAAATYVAAQECEGVYPCCKYMAVEACLQIRENVGCADEFCEDKGIVCEEMDSMKKVMDTMKIVKEHLEECKKNGKEDKMKECGKEFHDNMEKMIQKMGEKVNEPCMNACKETMKTLRLPESEE